MDKKAKTLSQSAKPKLSNKNIQPSKSYSSFSVLRSQLLIIFLFSIGLYINTLFSDFTLDDTLKITQNKFTKMGFAGIGPIMSNDAFVGFFGKNKNLLPGGRYRPLSQVLCAIQYQFFGLSPLAGHLTNILLYALMCILVFLLLDKLFQKFKTPNLKFKILTFPFIIALLFTAHPLHTEVVANIKSCEEILVLIFVSLSMLLTLKYVDKAQVSNFKFQILNFILFLLALLDKENAVTFIAIIPLTLFIFRKISLKDHLFILANLLFSFVVYLFIRYEALGFLFSNNAYEKELLNNPFINADTAQKYATIMLTWGKYLLLMLFPYNLTHDYYPKQIPIIGWSDFRAIIPFILYTAFSVYAIISIFNSKFKTQNSKLPVIAYAILLYMLTFSIESNLVFNIGIFMNERFMFISVLGFCIILAYFLTFTLRSSLFARSLLFIILLVYSVKTISRNNAWKDDYTLFTTDVNTSSNSAKCNVSAGGMYFEKAKKETDSINKRYLLEMAQHYITKGLSIHPYYHAGWILSGNVYLEMKDYLNAAKSYETVLNFSPKHPDAMNNLLFVAQQTDKVGLVKESLDFYKALYKYNPDETDYLLNLASEYAKVGRSDTALIILNNILLKKPDYYSAYNKMGEIFGRYYNDLNKSLVYLNKAFSINPKDPSVLENLGVAYGIKADYKQSEEYFQKALKVKPDNSEVYRNLSNTYRNMGNIALANQMLIEAQKLDQKKK